MSDSKPSLPQSSAPDPPAFGCIVYVRRTETGRTIGRVANLSGSDALEIEAGSEREVLTGLVRAAKRVLAEHIENSEEIPWLDPPAAKRDDEQKRFLPLHL